MKPILQYLIPALVVGSFSLVGKLEAQVAPPVPTKAAGESASGATSVRPSSRSGADDDFLPEAYARDRHQATWANSPFGREVLPPPPEEEGPKGPDPWEGWKIAAIDKFGGNFTVGLTTKKNEFVLLKVGEENEEHGITVTKVESSGAISDAVIFLTDGSRSGEISFDSARLSQQAKGAPAAKAKPRAAATSQNRNAVPQTPQQRAAAAAAAKQSQAKISTHLQNAASTPPRPGTATQAQPAATTPTPPTRSRRRSVVLPPSSRR